MRRSARGAAVDLTFLGGSQTDNAAFVGGDGPVQVNRFALAKQVAGLSGGGLGGSGSSGGQGGQPSGSGSAAPGSKADSARAQKYLDCAKKANAVAELQACGDLLK